MKLTEKILVAVLVLGFTIIPSQRIFGQSNVAIHATTEEVEIWKQRTVSDSYKDVWSIIKNRADAFVSNPEARWPGQTTNSCYNPNVAGTPGRIRDRGLRDAAFVYLLTGKTSYRDAVRVALLAQAATPGTDFSNTARWCTAVGTATNQEPANWLRRLAYAYSYIRAGISAGDKATLDAFFLKAGNFFEVVIGNPPAVRFSNRLEDNYTSCGSGGSACPGKDDGILYFGGPTVKNFHKAWTNKAASDAAFVAAVGVLVNNTTLKARAKRFVEEWFKFAVWPNGAVVDQNRWHGFTPQLGYTYAGTAIGSIVTIVDHLARDGDTSLYRFATSDGMFGTEGGPKSLLSVLQHFAALTNGTVREYASITSASNAKFLIDHTAEISGKDAITYVNMAPANLYYKNQSIKTAYLTPIPRSYASGGYDSRGGDWGSYPDILFMFGEMENLVLPYPTGVAAPTMSLPAAPVKLFVSP